MADFCDGHIDPGCFQIKRRGVGDERRARPDLPEQAPQSLIAPMDRLEAPTAGTIEARLFAAVERGIAELVRAAGRNAEGADDLHVRKPTAEPARRARRTEC
jgi:hypothetical protein